MSLINISGYSCTSYINDYNGNVKEIVLTINEKPKEKKKKKITRKGKKKLKKEDLEVDLEDETSGDSEPSGDDEYVEDDFVVKDEDEYDRSILNGVVPNIDKVKTIPPVNDLGFIVTDRIAIGKQDTYNVVGDIKVLTSPLFIFDLTLRKNNENKYEVVKISNVTRKCEIEHLTIKAAQAIIKKTNIFKGNAVFASLITNRKKSVNLNNLITYGTVSSIDNPVINNIFECFFIKNTSKFFSWYNYFIISVENLSRLPEVDTDITPILLENSEKLFFDYTPRAILFENIKLTEKLIHIYEASKIYHDYKNNLIKFGTIQYNEQKDGEWSDESYNILKTRNDIECGLFSSNKRRYIRSRAASDNIKKLGELMKNRTIVIRAENDFSNDFKAIFSKCIKEKNDVVIIKNSYRTSVYQQFSPVMDHNKITLGHCNIFGSYVIDRAHRYSYNSLLELISKLDLSMGKKIKLIGTPFYKSSENIIRDLLFLKDNGSTEFEFEEYNELYGLNLLNHDVLIDKNITPNFIKSDCLTNIFLKDVKKYKDDFIGKNFNFVTVHNSVVSNIDPTVASVIIEDGMKINELITVMQNIVFSDKFRTFIISDNEELNHSLMNCRFVPSYNNFVASLKNK